MVVENRPGGDGLVAINAFTSANDDHTLLFVPASTFTAHPYTHDKLPYDSERDLLPIVNVTVIVIALRRPESLKARSLADFVALARAKPDTLNVAAAAGNSDLIMSGFIKTQNLPVTKVPYRDILQAPNDLAEGRIQLLMSSYASMRAARSGRKDQGARGDQPPAGRHRAGHPTVAEAGFPFLGLDSLIGIFGPRGMSGALRESIAADVRPSSRRPTIAGCATGRSSMSRPRIRRRHQGDRDQLADRQALGISGHANWHYPDDGSHKPKRRPTICTPWPILDEALRGSSVVQAVATKSIEIKLRGGRMKAMP